MVKLSANISIMFTEVPFLERFARAADCGLSAVECWFPYQHSTAQIAEQLERHELDLVSLNTPPGDPDNGEFGLAIFRERQNEFHHQFELALEYAKSLACPNIHVLAGNVPLGAERGPHKSVFIENLEMAARLAQPHKIRLLIEPLNAADRPHYFLSDQDQAAEILAQLSTANVALMFDAYHVQMTEHEVLLQFAMHRSRVGHIQIADAPGRNEPGTGAIDFEAFARSVAASGYSGYVGCEYRPSGSTEASFAWRPQFEAALRGVESSAGENDARDNTGDEP